MASLFSDDRPSGGRAPSRKYPARAKAVAAELPPLADGWVLAHCDGGARGNPGPAGFGAEVVDAQGTSLAELSEFLGFRTNNFAEYAGLLAVLAWALEHHHPKLRVISDSELMVRQIQGKYKVNSPELKALHEEARKRISRLEGFEIHHALRHKNKVADALANAAMDRGMGKHPGASAPAPTRATPYPVRAAAPPVPASFEPRSKTLGTAASNAAALETAGTMMRGFVSDGVVHVLGGKTLPDGTFVKILPESPIERR